MAFCHFSGLCYKSAMTPARPDGLPRLLLALLAGLSLWLFSALPGHAGFQTNGAVAAITEVDASAFPDMAVRVSVRNASGQSVAGLPVTAFALAENGVPVPALAMSQAEVGVQVVFLIVPDDSFAKRDAAGVSRYEHIQSSVDDFLRDHPWMRNGQDDVSILTPGGPLLLHGSTGAGLYASLAAYVPVVPPAEFALLAQVTNALEIAQPVGPSQGRGAAVVVYTSGLSNVTPDQIDLAASQARALGVPIHAVNISPPLEPESVSAANLRRLAEGSGGQMLYFTEVDSATPVFETIASQRLQYLLSYRSGLSASGLPAITVLVRLPGGAEPVTSDPASFSLDVLPPEVAVSGLEADVRRELSQARANAASDRAQSQEMRVAVTFPDGHQRNLTRLHLLVDGEIAGEVTEPPFNRITWNLADSSLQSGAHAVQVQVTDELGLTAVSPPFQVTITDVEPAAQPAPLEAPARLQVPWMILGIAAGVLALLGGGALLVLRLRPRLISGLDALADTEEFTSIQPPASTETALAPPGNLPAPGRPPAEASFAAPADGATQAGPRPAAVPRAYLEVIHVGAGSRPPIELTARPVTLGRDPALASITFSDRSVSRLHARVTVDEKGAFLICDEGSTSGTWVNYEQVSSAGRALQHGDLVNLGRVQLRFRVRPADGAGAPPPGPGAGHPAAGRPRDDTTIPFKPKRRRWGRFG
jgi:hypothetical protein